MGGTGGGMKLETRTDYRRRRHRRVRKKVAGTGERPRAAILISNRHIYVQFIDDEKGQTILSVSTLGSDEPVNAASAGALGKRAGEAAVAKGIRRAVVDRGGFRFHGRVKAVVDAMVAAGVRISEKAPEGPRGQEDK